MLLGSLFQDEDVVDEGKGFVIFLLAFPVEIAPRVHQPDRAEDVVQFLGCEKGGFPGHSLLRPGWQVDKQPFGPID